MPRSFIITLITLFTLTHSPALPQKVYTLHDLFTDTEITWYGIDYTRSEMVGTFGEKDLHDYYKGWNTLILVEAEKYNVAAALNSTLSVITLNGEKYVNATSGGVGSGILPIGNAINVVPGEKYLIRIKGYRSTYNAGIMIRRNNTTISYGSYLPTPVSNEAWIEQVYIVPPNTNVLEIGLGWPVTTGSAGLNLNAFELIKLESAAPEYQ